MSAIQNIRIFACVAALCFIFGCKTENKTATASEKVPEILVDVDFYDHVNVAKHWFGVEFFGPKEIDDIFKNCKESGVSIVYWRAYTQVANYPSKINYNLADVGNILSSPDDRRSEGAFSARVGVKKMQQGGIVQAVKASGKDKYVFSGDLVADSPCGFLAILDPAGNILFSGKPAAAGKGFISQKLEFEYDGPFQAAVLSNGGKELGVFIADNLSLKNSAGKELLKNGNMEIPDMLQPRDWKPFNATFVFINGDYRKASPEIKKKYLPNAEPWFRMLDRPYAIELNRKTMKSCDTLAEAVKCARKYGIKIYAWTDPIDDGRVVLPPLASWASKFLEEHPEFRPVDKNGRTRWGMLCYGYPEVRKYKTEVIKELLSYGVDGVALKMSYQHNQVWDGNSYDYKDFLYNDVALKEYWKIKGKPANGEYDVGVLQNIYGGFFIQWLRELRPVIEESGKRLCLFQGPNKYLDHAASVWKIDPMKIINEKLIDDFLIEPRSTASYKDQFSIWDSVNGYSEACRRNNIKLGYDFYLNGLVEANKKVKDKGPRMKEDLLYVAKEPVDFVGIYECMYIDKLKLWPYVKSFAEEIKSPDFKRKSINDKIVIKDEMKGRRNIALAEKGVIASLVLPDAKRRDASDMVDGDISDGSAYMVRGAPFDVEISFPEPQTVDSFRLYHGRASYAGNPSGESGIKSFSAEGLVNGKWISLVPSVDNIPRLDPAEKNIFTYNTICRFKPVTLEKIRFRITSSNDTGCRTGSGDKAIVPEKDRVVFIREIEVFSVDVRR